MTAFNFPIVGIGASAGGLEAFRGFFERMPADSGMAFIVILHLPAERKSMLPDILARWTPMRVFEAADAMYVEPNCVYVPPPHAAVTLMDGRLSVKVPAIDDQKAYRPIDSLFDALALALRDQAVGIVLSGTGSDGSLGLKAIKGSGGLTIAQGGADGGAPQYSEMPAGAIATGFVDLVAPVEEMPGHLVRLKRVRLAALAPLPDAERTSEAARLEICTIVREQLGHDFSGYRDKTFMRRVQRRMQVLNLDSLEDYMTRLRSDQQEVGLLFRDLLVRVTSFFRDKDTFDAMETIVIPRLFGRKTADSAVRIWVPGCATGEEAYSLAILLCEYLDKLRGAPKVQLFGTDIDEAAIATARLGRYPATLLEGLSADRRERFFRSTTAGCVVSKEIRQLCTFSAHSVVRDPPFSRMDLVSCRNLLIYMDAPLQAALLPRFHYSLVPDGILLLGSSESASKHADLFEPLDKKLRIFRRLGGKSRSMPLAPPALDLVSGSHLDSFGPRGQRGGTQVAHRTDAALTVRMPRTLSRTTIRRSSQPAHAPHPGERLRRALEPCCDGFFRVDRRCSSTSL